MHVILFSLACGGMEGWLQPLTITIEKVFAQELDESSSEGSGELVSIPMENGSGARKASIELGERQPLKMEAERRESNKHASSSQVGLACMTHAPKCSVAVQEAGGWRLFTGPHSGTVLLQTIAMRGDGLPLGHHVDV